MTRKCECAVVSTTVADESAAADLAGRAVEARLAACAHIAPIRSVYRWKGVVERDSEVSLRFKTMPDRAEDLVAFIRSNHSYELPEILVERAEASPDYLAWVKVETSSNG